jgi:hypothetical protein
LHKRGTLPRFCLDDRMPSELHTFHTDTARKNYVRSVIAGIGLCTSIKAVSTDAFETVLAIVQNHPEATAKLHDIEDFYITKNAMNGNGYTLMIKKTTGNAIDVSYIVSATGKGASMPTVFHNCLRVSIEPQTRKFKDGCTDKICAMCSKDFTKDTGCEVDHVKFFAEIVEEFIAMQAAPFAYPTETKECTDGTSRYRLADAHSDLEQAFIAYHALVATLRLTCKKCNQKRKRS